MEGALPLVGLVDVDDTSMVGRAALVEDDLLTLMLPVFDGAAFVARGEALFWEVGCCIGRSEPGGRISWQTLSLELAVFDVIPVIVCWSEVGMGPGADAGATSCFILGGESSWMAESPPGRGAWAAARLLLSLVGEVGFSLGLGEPFDGCTLDPAGTCGVDGICLVVWEVLGLW